MNCRQAKQLLPLWIGRDLGDAAESEALQAHLSRCGDCSRQQFLLQQSLEALQSVSTAALADSGAAQPCLWPRLAMRLNEIRRRRDHFNGWIPATAMALAASAMVAVSVVQIRREMSGSVHPSARRNLFMTDSRFAPGAPAPRDFPVSGLVKQPAEATPDF